MVESLAFWFVPDLVRLRVRLIVAGSSILIGYLSIIFLVVRRYRLYKASASPGIEVEQMQSVL